MELDLTPKTAEALFEGDGGGYYTWSSSQMPPLGKFNVGAGRLLLNPRGFALPHYADTSKVGYVIQGTDGVVGLILPNSGKEVVLKLKQGDIIPVPIGAVSWWFNDGDSDLIIAFLGETSKGLIPGQFTYFFLTGAQGLIGSFSAELTGNVYAFNKNDVNKLTKSQTGVLIIKLDTNKPMPKPQMDQTAKLVYNIDAARPDSVDNHAGLVTTLTDKAFPFIEDVGLSVIRVKLEPNAIKAPSYQTTPLVQVIYIARGSGKIEIVGLNGQRVLDTQVKAGHLIVVPPFFAVAEIAGPEGLERYSIVTTTKPSFQDLAGRGSVWVAFSPQLLDVALNVDSDFEKLFIAKNQETTNLIPPPKGKVKA